MNFANGVSSLALGSSRPFAEAYLTQRSSDFRAARELSLLRYIESVPVDAVGLDWMIELGFAREQVQSVRPVQGNLDPLALLAGGAALDRSIDAILEAFAAGPFIFNLGHGVLPETPLAHVERMIARVRGAASKS